jgi:integrase
MAGKRQRANGWEYVFKRAGVLDKPLYMTFADEAEGDAYAERVERLLDRGVAPHEARIEGKVRTISALVREYLRDAHPSTKDQGALGTICSSRGETPLLSINSGWVDEWIAEMKRVDNISPSTIRSKVGALARCTDWGVRKGHLVLPDHPLRSLPDGYSQYTARDGESSGDRRTDVERDRRLESDEAERILAVLDSGILPRAQRPLKLANVDALRCFFTLAQESAMRMREMYTLTAGQVDLPRRTVFLDKTKNGDKRQVPLSSVAVAALEAYLNVHPAKGEAPIFPWWQPGMSAKQVHGVSDFLSSLWSSIFKAAGCENLKFHDLRHEAVSRLFERTTLSETAIMRISGHKSHRMLLRYANLRASTLADSLW